MIEKGVVENNLDFALIEGNVHSEKLVSEVILDDELIPICSMNHPLAGKVNVEISELIHEDFLMREPESGTRQLAQSVFAMQSFEIKPKWESTSTAALINAVAEGIGISVLPKRMIEEQLETGKVASFQIEGINLKRNYKLIYHKHKYISESIFELFGMIRMLKNS